jgi:hypothetical protein
MFNFNHDYSIWDTISYMIELQIKKKELQIFEAIISAYKDITIIDSKDLWKNLSNNELWFWHVGQIMIVGSSNSKARFDNNDELKKLIHLNSLKKITDERKLLEVINYVLRQAGVRYASEDPNRCLKSKALLHNYLFITGYKGGLKSILKKIDTFSGENFQIERIQFLMEHLKYMKNKSARDFLMGLGMNRNTIAIDIRIQNVFKHAGIVFPLANELANAKVYDETEQEIIEKICRPLSIEPIVFDRILYQNYTKILSFDYLMPNLF